MHDEQSRAEVLDRLKTSEHLSTQRPVPAKPVE